MASASSSHQVGQGVTMASYVRLPCQTCGQHTWTSEPSELAQCGRCRRNGQPPVMSPLLSSASAAASPEPQNEHLDAASTAPACPVCFEVEADKAEYASVANESWENSDRCNAHGICKPCLQRYVEVKVLDEGLWNLRCPGEGCTYRLINDDISEALAKSERREEALALHSRLRSESFAPRLEEMLVSQNAVSADSSMEMLLAECQVCPNCSVLVRREGGCTHIVCRCGQDFCFGCGAPLSDDGDDCCCDEREETIPEEDEMEGEGRPAFGFWRRRNMKKPDSTCQIAEPAAPESDLASELPEKEKALPKLIDDQASEELPRLLRTKSAEEFPRLLRATSLL